MREKVSASLTSPPGPAGLPAMWHAEVPRCPAVDISPELLAAAADLSRHIRPPIEFRLGDAEQLPFGEGIFDGVISTFGVMFAVDQAAAVAELGRVCRSAGRLALATWAPEGTVAEFFRVIAQHSDAPSPSSPLAWGDPAQIRTVSGFTTK